MGWSTLAGRVDLRAQNREHKSGHTATVAKTARVLEITVDKYGGFVKSCEDAIFFKFRQNEAKSTPPTDKDKSRWEGVPVRRCPACLDCVSSRCSSCLLCKAVFLCRPRLPSEASKDGEDQSARPKAKTQPKAKAKPPVYKAESTTTPSSASAAASAPDAAEALTPRLNLPEVFGVVWGTYEHPTAQIVVPEKREGSATPGTGISPAPNFLNFSNRASGNHVSLNATHALIVSNKNLAIMRATWPVPSEPSIQPFIRFLEKRPTDRGGSLMDLLDPPTE